MKYCYHIILPFLILITVSCKGKEPKINDYPQSDEEAFIAVENVVQDLFDEVWAGYDKNAVTKYQTDDFLLLEHGEVWNNDTIINWCKEAQTRNSGYERINNFERIKAKRNGDKVWLAYHNYGTFKKDTIQFELGWLESVVAIKLDTIWKIELMHSTRIELDSY